jgi:hypothetical protein
MVKRKAGSGSRSGGSKAPTAGHSAPIGLVANAPGSGGRRGRLALWVLAAAAIVYLFVHHLSHDGVDLSSGASHPSWGQSVKLELAGKFEDPDELMALRADASGTLYALSKDRICSFKDGHKSDCIELKIEGNERNLGAAWAMAMDGDFLYVTTRDNHIIKVRKNLSKVDSVINFAGGSDLLGIDASPKGLLYVSDIQLHQVFMLSQAGKVRGTLGGSQPEAGSLNCVVDVVLDSKGGAYTHDHISMLINHYNDKGLLLSSQPVPWTNHNWERLAILDGNLYLNGFNDHRIFIEDLDGKTVAQCSQLSDGSKLDSPRTMAAGLDGYLYVKDGSTIYKLKPWSAAPSAAAKGAAAK